MTEPIHLELGVWNEESHKGANPMAIPIEQLETWLRLSKRGIGGGSTAAILGRNPYRTEAQTWDHIFRTVEPRFGDKKYQRRGIVLEPIVMDEIELQYDYRALCKGTPDEHPELWWLKSSPDYFIEHQTPDLVETGQGICEIKTVGMEELAEIKLTGVRAQDFIQVQQYMYVHDLRWSIVAYFHADSWTLHVIGVLRDEAYIETTLLGRVVDWWRDHVLTRQRPADAMITFPVWTPRVGGEAVDWSKKNERLVLIDQFIRTKADFDIMEKRMEAVKTRLKEAMQEDEADLIICGEHKIYFKEVKGKPFFDHEHMVAEHPELRDLVQKYHKRHPAYRKLMPYMRKEKVEED